MRGISWLADGLSAKNTSDSILAVTKLTFL
jgi:hypothetical protein